MACSLSMTERETIIVYWRPGCGFCSKLLRGLDNRGIPHTRLNIWDEPTAAARVRAITGGNETVPTVTVGDRALVNPRLDEVVRLADPAATTVHEPDESPTIRHRRRRRSE